jgi:site-specific recombinase XerD
LHRPDYHQFDDEELSVRELLITLLGPKARRKLKLRNLSNDQLFKLYDDDLVLRTHNARNLDNERRLLAKFREFIGEYPPTPELVKSFLGCYTDRKPRTVLRYAATLKSFMKWYGEDMDDLKIKAPKTLPQYVEESQVNALIERIAKKKTHKRCIERDILLIELAVNSGMRREELAKLTPGDIHTNFLIAHGKGMKDRTIPLPSHIAEKLQQFIKGMSPNQSVFGMDARSITNKVYRFAKAAGVNLHTHSLRHRYATHLLELGADVRSVQKLLGHAELGTTQVYLDMTDKHARQAVALLEKSNNDKTYDELVGKYGKGYIEGLRLRMESKPQVIEFIKSLD